MSQRQERLADFTDAIVKGRCNLFEPLVESAYVAGAWHSDLLTAVDIARALAPVAPRIVRRAHTAVDDLRWLEVRHPRVIPELAPGKI